MKNGFVSPWDDEWFYHFRTGGYSTIEWLEIALVDEQQRVAVLEAFRKIHVPGETQPNAIRIYGYVQPGASVAYL